MLSAISAPSEANKYSQETMRWFPPKQGQNSTMWHKVPIATFSAQPPTGSARALHGLHACGSRPWQCKRMAKDGEWRMDFRRPRPFCAIGQSAAFQECDGMAFATTFTFPGKESPQTPVSRSPCTAVPTTWLSLHAHPLPQAKTHLIHLIHLIHLYHLV